MAGDTLWALLSNEKENNARPYTEEIVGRFCFGMHNACISRSLFRCTNGIIGLGPRLLQPGDQVVEWLGCDTAMAF